MLAAAAAIASGLWLTRAAPDGAASYGAAAQPASTARHANDPHPAANGAASAKRERSARAVRASAAQPLPPPGTPLAAVFDELEARADAGDAAAASRLYHDVHRCHATQFIQRLVASTAPAVLTGDARALSDDELKAQDERLKWMQDELRQVDANRELCAGVTQAQIDSLVPSALRAAQLGDVKAIGCYVGMSFDMMPGLLDHPEWLLTSGRTPRRCSTWRCTRATGSPSN